MLKLRAEYRGVQLNTTCQTLPGAGLSQYHQRTEHYLPGPWAERLAAKCVRVGA
jgi:hypothetical protein